MKHAKRLIGLILPLILLLVWWYATTFTAMSHAILPSLPEVAQAFSDLTADGTLWGDLSVSLGRVLRGYVIAALLGVFLGSAMGMWKPFRAFLLPSVTAVRQIPVIAWIPLIILWCGIGETSKVVVIAIAAFFPITVNTLGGIQSVPAEYLEMTNLYQFSSLRTFRKVCLPYALPQILVGLKLGLGSAWMAVVAAELIASSSGIGYRLSYARGLMRSDIVILCMVVIGLVGILMDHILTHLFSRLLPWRKKLDR